MYQGYLALGGTEIANAARTTAYVRTQMPSIPLRNKYEIDNIPVALGDEPYTSPAIDDADWLDPAIPASQDFFGLYPLAIEGVENSTRTLPIIESILDGASHGFPRHASKTVRVRGMLIARTDAGLEYGHAWLNAALEQVDCGSHAASCGTGSLSYFTAYPLVSNCCYRLGELMGAMENFGNIDPGDGTVRFDLWKEAECRPVKVSWRGGGYYNDVPLRDAWAPGTTVRWGYVERDFTEVPLHAAVTVRRDNVMLNPAFRENLSTWGVSAGTTRVTEGGPGGLPFARTAAGPSFVQSALMSAGRERAMLSFDYRAADGQELTVTVAAAGEPTIVQTLSGQIGDGWQRVYVPVTTGDGVTVRVAGVGPFDVTGFLFEAGESRRAFFDDETAPEASHGYGYTVANLPRAQWPIASALWDGLVEPDYERLPMKVALDHSPRSLTFDVIFGSVRELTLDQSIWLPVEMDEQLRPYSRFLHDVDTVTGATTLREYAPEAGAIREVEFYVNAGVPHQFSLPRLGGFFGGRETAVPQAECVTTIPDPLVDPDLPVIPPPPRPPAVPTLGVDEVPLWERFWMHPPSLDDDPYNEELDRINYSSSIPVWLTSVPTMAFRTRDLPIRQLRVRFYPNPFGRQLESDETGQPIDLCSYCAEFIIGYIPPDSTLVVDGVSRHAWLNTLVAENITADHVMYGTDGVPMEWPELSCGTDYLVSIDIPSTDAEAISEDDMYWAFSLQYTDRG